MRELNRPEKAWIVDVLGRLCEHFHQWRDCKDYEHATVAFAFYEGCGDSRHCGDILAEAAPIALGKELVAHHGFRWVMLESGDSWSYGVMHPALEHPIGLASLEDASWNHRVYEMPPARGETTNDSLDMILRQVRRRRRGIRAGHEFAGFLASPVVEPPSRLPADAGWRLIETPFSGVCVRLPSLFG